jgi:metallo-beta-lactamase family protein
MKITFLGAAGEVTGSQHLIETDDLRILLDCGFYQGHRAEAYAKNAKFHCKPKQLDAVILSHAHIDHCGNLPGLYKAGFRGPIFCTRATADVADIMLRDSVGIQKEDAKYLARHAGKDAPPITPLYEEEHVKKVVKLFEPLDYHEWHDLSPAFRLRFADAGHILGSAITEMMIEDQGDMRRVVFTGDLGRRNLPVLRDPETVPGCDVLISESTYGNKLHPPADDIKEALLQIIHRIVETEGKLIIPAFSLGRTQNIIYYLNELWETGRLPKIPVYLDSPLSHKLTLVFRAHQEIMDAHAQHMLHIDEDLFGFPMLETVRSVKESVELNYLPGPFVVISASGMCENGRVRHHLKHGLGDERNIVALIGFQAEHTLGRRLVEGQTTVKIFDRMVPVRARIEVLNGLSAHADAEDFKWWFESLASEGGIGQAFLVHGEEPAAKALAALIRDCCDEDPIIPQFRQTFEV